MEQIFTYFENRFIGKRSYELYPDKVCVRGNVCLKSDFDVVVELKHLDPNFEKIRVREIGISVGLWMILGPLFIMFILYSAFDVKLTNLVMGFMFILAVCGVFVSVVTFKKIELYRFKNLSGIPALDVARCGRGKPDFDIFVEKLVSCINSCQSGINQQD